MIDLDFDTLDQPPPAVAPAKELDAPPTVVVMKEFEPEPAEQSPELAEQLFIISLLMFLSFLT